MWRSLNHQFVLPFLGIYETESASQFFLVSPYMKNGTLAQWRKKAYRSTTEIEKLVRVFLLWLLVLLILMRARYRKWPKGLNTSIRKV